MPATLTALGNIPRLNNRLRYLFQVRTLCLILRLWISKTRPHAKERPRHVGGGVCFGLPFGGDYAKPPCLGLMILVSVAATGTLELVTVTRAQEGAVLAPRSCRLLQGGCPRLAS
jgi:hypothetical protein